MMTVEDRHSNPGCPRCNSVGLWLANVATYTCVDCDVDWWSSDDSDWVACHSPSGDSVTWDPK